MVPAEVPECSVQPSWPLAFFSSLPALLLRRRPQNRKRCKPCWQKFINCVRTCKLLRPRRVERKFSFTGFMRRRPPSPVPRSASTRRSRPWISFKLKGSGKESRSKIMRTGGTALRIRRNESSLKMRSPVSNQKWKLGPRKNRKCKQKQWSSGSGCESSRQNSTSYKMNSIGWIGR